MKRGKKRVKKTKNKTQPQYPIYIKICQRLKLLSHKLVPFIYIYILTTKWMQMHKASNRWRFGCKFTINILVDLEWSKLPVYFGNRWFAATLLFCSLVTWCSDRHTYESNFESGCGEYIGTLKTLRYGLNDCQQTNYVHLVVRLTFEWRFRYIEWAIFSLNIDKTNRTRNSTKNTHPMFTRSHLANVVQQSSEGDVLGMNTNATIHLNETNMEYGRQPTQTWRCVPFHDLTCYDPTEEPKQAT